MANEQNLNHKLTVNEQRKGGQNSGKARRSKELNESKGVSKERVVLQRRSIVKKRDARARNGTV